MVVEAEDIREGGREREEAAQEVDVLLALRGEGVCKVHEPDRYVGVLGGGSVALVDDQHRGAIEVEVALQLRTPQELQPSAAACLRNIQCHKAVSERPVISMPSEAVILLSGTNT